VALQFDRVLFEAVGRQLDAKGVVVKTGTLVDATVLPSAGIKHDEAMWAGHRRRKPVHGYKAHVAPDESGGIIRAVEVTAANVHDGRMLEAMFPEAPDTTYADMGYDSAASCRAVCKAGGVPMIAQRGAWGAEGGAAMARLRDHNDAVARVRCRVEKVFGPWKRSYGLRRMRWLELAKAGLQVRLAAIAYNLRRFVGLLGTLPA